MSGEGPPGTPADLARTLREAADRLMSGWTAALTPGDTAGSRDAGGTTEPAGPAPDAGRGVRRGAPEPETTTGAASSGTAALPHRAGGPGGPAWFGGMELPGAAPDLAALLGPLVPPATLSARQLQSVLDDIAARRTQVQALRAQLGLFDEQLAALEASLGPVLEWTQAWAGVEQKMTDLWRPPGP